LAIRMKGFFDQAVVALDRERQTIEFAELPAYHVLQRRQTAINPGRAIHLRVVSRLEQIEVYLDEELYLAFPRYRGIGGKVGLFVDRGTARFSGLRMRSLGEVLTEHEAE